MRPDNLKTRIFLDGGDPEETKKLIETLGFLDGQTTNPTLISKNPDVSKRLKSGDKFTKDEIMDFYRGIVQEISALIPNGSVSIEVYSDLNTTASQMITQAKEMNNWIKNAHIKFPATKEGLKAAHEVVKLGLRVNMTLVFSQNQAAAVYSATKGAVRGQVFVSPFVGRLDDKGENGMDLIKNILKMYGSGDGPALPTGRHVEVLTASVRNLDHFLEAIKLESDIITAPFKVLKEWAESGLPMPDENFKYNPNLKEVEYKELDLNKPWSEFNLENELTKKGIEKFSLDWDNLIK